jgi:hypothetical protein
LGSQFSPPPGPPDVKGRRIAEIYCHQGEKNPGPATGQSVDQNEVGEEKGHVKKAQKMLAQPFDPDGKFFRSKEFLDEQEKDDEG